MVKNEYQLRKGRRLVASLLRGLREEKGIRQMEIAQAVGQPQSFVSKYESGERRLDLAELKVVCDSLGISLAQFVDYFEAAIESRDQ